MPPIAHDEHHVRSQTIAARLVTQNRGCASFGADRVQRRDTRQGDYC
ncbi:hypothetical protein GK75_003885 [Salmonella enterica subsp. enterica]|nr:hypothetical protein [Salmonella enterica subsp. enterica]